MPVETARRLSLPRGSISVTTNNEKIKLAALRAKMKSDENKDAVSFQVRLPRLISRVAEAEAEETVMRFQIRGWDSY